MLEPVRARGPAASAELAVKHHCPSKGRRQYWVLGSRLQPRHDVAALAIAAPACAATSRHDLQHSPRLEFDGPDRWDARRDQFIGQVGSFIRHILGLQEVVAARRPISNSACPATLSSASTATTASSAGEYSKLGRRPRSLQHASSGTFWLSPTPRCLRKAGTRLTSDRDLGASRPTQRRHASSRSTPTSTMRTDARLEGARDRRLARSEPSGRRISGDRSAISTREAGSPPYQAADRQPARPARCAQFPRSPAVGPDGTWNDFRPRSRTSQRIDSCLSTRA